MKAKEYVKKYKLESSKHFDRNSFCKDMELEFLDLFKETNKSIPPLPRFEKVVNDLKGKWDSVFRRTDFISYEEAEKFWNYFFATSIIKIRTELFGDWKKAKHNYRYTNDPDFRRRYDNWQFHKEMEQEENRWYNAFNEDFFQRALNSLRFRFNNIAVHCGLLGLSSDEITKESVQKAYRTLSIQHHPDQGGLEENFIKITNAKDKILEYLEGV